MNQKQIRQVVLARDEGRCVVTGEYLVDPESGIPFGQYSVHHRTPRGMGGSKDPMIHGVSNLILVSGTGTTGTHGRIESSRSWAVDEGLIVPRGTDPATVPILHYGFGLAWATPWGTWATCFTHAGASKAGAYALTLAEHRDLGPGGAESILEQLESSLVGLGEAA